MQQVDFQKPSKASLHQLKTNGNSLRPWNWNRVGRADDDAHQRQMTFTKLCQDLSRPFLWRALIILATIVDECVEESFCSFLQLIDWLQTNLPLLTPSLQTEVHRRGEIETPATSIRKAAFWSPRWNLQRHSTEFSLQNSRCGSHSPNFLCHSRHTSSRGHRRQQPWNYIGRSYKSRTCWNYFCGACSCVLKQIKLQSNDEKRNFNLYHCRCHRPMAQSSLSSRVFP